MTKWNRISQVNDSLLWFLCYILTYFFSCNVKQERKERKKIQNLYVFILYIVSLYLILIHITNYGFQNETFMNDFYRCNDRMLDDLKRKNNED